jgi:hypothetical protein
MSKLPPLPDSFPAGYIAQTEYFYTAAQMIAYGKACRGEALEQAADACDGKKWVIGAYRTSTYMETFNKACDDCIGMIRRMI